MASTKKIILWGSALTLLGVGGYLLYKRLRKPKTEPSKEPVKEGETPTPMPSLPPIAKPPFTPNPFKNEFQVRAFQNWVINVAKDPKILGKSGADGKWGENTAAAWDKYGGSFTFRNRPSPLAPVPAPPSWGNYGRPNWV